VQLRRAARIETASGAPDSFTLVTSRDRYEGLQLPLAGRHQRDNAAMAVLAAEALDELGALPAPVTREAIVSGVASASWPGRLQIVGREPLFLLDGAHNPAGCAALARSVDDLRARGEFDRLCLVFGALKEKDVPSMAREIFPRADRVILTRGRSERFREPQDVARETEGTGPEPPSVMIVEELGAAIEEARRWCGGEDAVLLCGSLYLVGDALALMGVDPFPHTLQKPLQ